MSSNEAPPVGQAAAKNRRATAASKPRLSGLARWEARHDLAGSSITRCATKLAGRTGTKTNLKQLQRTATNRKWRLAGLATSCHFTFASLVLAASLCVILRADLAHSAPQSDPFDYEHDTLDPDHVPGDGMLTLNSQPATMKPAQVVATSKTPLRVTTTPVKLSIHPDEPDDSIDDTNPKRKQLEQALKELLQAGKKVESRKNHSIIINGRKFDQVNPIECIDSRFYTVLWQDINLINPIQSSDEYETYFDRERARTVDSILTPRLVAIQSMVPQDEDVRSGSRASPLDDHNYDSDMSSGMLLNRIKAFWAETNRTYLRTARALNLKFSRQRRATKNTEATTSKPEVDKLSADTGSRAEPTADDSQAALGEAFSNLDDRPVTAPSMDTVLGKKTRPDYRKALDNHYYLLNQLQKLKSMLLDGEEELIILYNRVKKLKEAVSEVELRQALCSCITARGGRAAMMLMSELFTDKYAMETINKPEVAKSKAEASARDTAEFCAYWYGDTLRTQAIAKETAIKDLVVRFKKKFTRVTTKIESVEVEYIRVGNVTRKVIRKETEMKVLKSVVEMTRLWRPQLAAWITNKLGQKLTDLLAKFQGNGTKREKREKRSSDKQEMFMSTPFDHSSLYSDLDEGEEFDSTVQSFVDNYGELERVRRQVESSASPKHGESRAHETASTTAQPERRASGTSPGQSRAASTSKTDTKGRFDGFETKTFFSSNKCAKDGFKTLLEIAYDQNALLYETSKIKRSSMYIETLRTAFTRAFPRYWIRMRDKWSRLFTRDALDRHKRERDELGRKDVDINKLPSITIDSKRTSEHTEHESVNITIDNIGGDVQGEKNKNMTSRPNLPDVKTRITIDEVLDESFQTSGDAYERGARLGYTIGRFIGMKSANQWPDPVELNTFTYDSIFLAGVGLNYTEQQTKDLEALIVTETAKRVAYSEASRKVFASALHTAYLNGAFIVPKFGVLHGQRAVAKRALIEGAQVGYDAATAAAEEFKPQAMKFISLHEHQRTLAEPYKKSSLDFFLAGKSLEDRIKEVRKESVLNANVNRVIQECGKKTGAIMGALVGLLVVPEAFETYARHHGSLEAVEQEFYRYKLGALRGYELGESWALLNYTETMAKNLESIRASLGEEKKLTSTTKKPRVWFAGRSSRKNSLAETTAKSDTTDSTTRSRRRKRQEDLEAQGATVNRTRIPDDNLVATMAETDPLQTNVNNVFQYMVINYGQRVVSNHSKQSMLVMRGLITLEDSVLANLKAQSGDLVVTPPANLIEVEDRSEVFQTTKIAGELNGVLEIFAENSKRVPLKLEIMDLGPMIEFADESTKPRSGRNNTGSPVRVMPLTEAMSKVNKIYIKLRVPKKVTEKEDPLKAVLNNDQADGDGFVCGSYSLLNDNQLDKRGREMWDDLSLQEAILDELHERIENASSLVNKVQLTAQAMKVATVAPDRVQRLTMETTKSPLSTTKKPLRMSDLFLSAETNPALEAPASKAPVSKAPVSKAPASKARASKAPASKAPASKAPASKAPAPKAPASQAPVSKAPVSKAPAKKLTTKSASGKARSGLEDSTTTTSSPSPATGATGAATSTASPHRKSNEGTTDEPEAQSD